VVVPGGTLRRDMASLIGGSGLELVRKFNIQIGLFGAHGITVAEGPTDVGAGEAKVKRPLVAMCRQVVAVLDATQWGNVGLASFADLKTVCRVITDVKAPAELVEQVRVLGVQVVLV
jgi:DeoR/GlpR family transcriptional regulator of sugar metabolism